MKALQIMSSIDNNLVSYRSSRIVVVVVSLIVVVVFVVVILTV